MSSHEASSLIEAAPEVIWRVLTDTAAWPDWDSGVTSVEGQPELGETLAIRVEANPGRAFPVKVVTLDEPERMVFRGGMPSGWGLVKTSPFAGHFQGTSEWRDPDSNRGHHDFQRRQ
jgi:uncharacterized protein YndB with AHSA1/START domain